MTSFTELTKRVHLINDFILSGMISVTKDYTEESMEFRNRLLITTNWFSRISYANKKRFVLALLGDVRSVWTLSLLLKSIWNCRPKDAVLSVCQSRVWSSYDQVPMDHNRTALPLSTLKEVMTNDRKWFMSLEPEFQVILLSKLLTLAGGPVMWAVLQRAQAIYENYLDLEVNNLKECKIVNEPVTEKVKLSPEPVKKDATPRKTSPVRPESGRPLPGQAQKELDANLAAWNANIRSMRDRMKLEELEMVFSDGTKKKVWKVNRPKPEAMETVDFVQLLPSEIGKRILKYIPTAQLSDCARVNKYWSYLVDELKTELATRQKINVELEKLKDNVMRHDTSLDLLTRLESQFYEGSSPGTVTELSRKLKTQTNLGLSAKTIALSFRQASKKNNLVLRQPQKPVKSLKELSERLQRRGAADENLWKWCKSILLDYKDVCVSEKKSFPICLILCFFCLWNNKNTEGLIPLGNTRFPCPLMKYNLSVPLALPLLKDPVESGPVKSKSAVNTFGLGERDNSVKQDNKRYNLWSKDMSGLYPVCKLPSYQFPV